jgi:hypothetical protein
VEGTLVSYGNIIKAFVILRAGQKPSDRLKQNLKYHVRMTLGPIAQPDDIEFVTSSQDPERQDHAPRPQGKGDGDRPRRYLHP